MNIPATQRAGKAAALAFVALESLPCGCVSAVYRARPTAVEMELLEVKGPHCRFFSHRAGHLVRFGVPGHPSGDANDTSP